MAVAAAASHPGTIPDQDSHNPASPDTRVVNQENYADLAGRLGIHLNMAKSD